MPRTNYAHYSDVAELTYSESAKGIVISKARALQELKIHGADDSEDVEFFLSQLGDHETYEAGSVLEFLGY